MGGKWIREARENELEIKLELDVDSWVLLLDVSLIREVVGMSVKVQIVIMTNGL